MVGNTVWMMMIMWIMMIDIRILLRRRWRIVFLRGWLILDMSGFPHSKPDSAVYIKPRSNYEEFFSVSDPPAPVSYFMMIYRRISEIQPTSSERAASLLRECRLLFNMLPLRRRAISLYNILTFVTYGFLDSDYSISAARARCANNFSQRFTMLLVLFRTFHSVTR